ncbi:hypothetical protein BH11ARM1_BH11ARM1_08280 [soil metagenome]
MFELGHLTREMTEEALTPLVGLALTDFRQPIFTIFEFGEQRPGKNRRGEDVTFADWSFDITGMSWQVVHHDRVVIGSSDMPYSGKRRPKRFFERITPPRDPELRSRWRAANDFLDLVEAGSLHAVAVSAGPAGATSIFLEEGYAIHTFTDSSKATDLWTLQHRPTRESFWAEAKLNGLIARKYELK